MKSNYLAVLFFCAAQGFSQSETIPQLVYSFPAGSGDQQLGMRQLGGDADTPVFSVAMVSDGMNFYILDNVNSRIVIADSRFVQSNQWTGVDASAGEIWLDDKYIVVGNNTYNPDRFFHNTYLNRLAGQTSLVVLDNYSVLGDNQGYEYVTNLGNLLIFERSDGGYFGVVTASGKDSKESPMIVSEEAVRSQIAGSTDARLTLKDNLLFVGDLMVSRAITKCLNLVASLPDFFLGKGNGGFLVNAKFLELPNKNYFFYGDREFWVLDSNGHLLNYVVLRAGDSLSRNSNFCPASDGYVYYLHGDLSRSLTNVYRVGPFDGLLLGYNGVGGVVNDDHINVRSEPSVSTKIINQVSRGTRVRILDQTKNAETIASKSAVWYHVRLWDRTEGWVFGQFLDIQK